jgi:hypothetical protein
MPIIGFVGENALVTRILEHIGGSVFGSSGSSFFVKRWVRVCQNEQAGVIQV